MAKRKKEIVNLIISDLQIPFHHQDAFSFLKAVKKKYKPTHVYSVGDETDMYNISKYAKDPEADSAIEEYNKMIDGLSELYHIFPKCMVATSNHTSRPFRTAFSIGLPKVFMKSYREFLQAPIGWEWQDEVLTTDGILIIHGDALTGGASRRKMSVRNYMKSVIYGHYHTESGIDYIANRDNLYFGMCVGCLIDHKSYAFAYQKKSPIKPILTVGITINGVPQLIPMILNDKGRWIGKL